MTTNYNIQNNIDAFGFLLEKGADNAIRLLAQDMGPVKQNNGKLIAYLMEGLKSLGKRDKPQATLKRCVRDMFAQFIIFMKNRHSFIDESTLNTFNDKMVKFIFKLEFLYGDILKKYDGKYFEINKGQELDKIVNNGQLLIDTFLNTSDKPSLDKFNNDFGKIATHDIFKLSFNDVSFDDVTVGTLTKDLFKRFFENMQNNEYSTYNFILRNMKPEDNKKVSALMKDLFEELYKNKELTTKLDNAFNTFNDANLEKYLDNLEPVIDKNIIDLFNDRFKTDYVFLSLDDKQKIKNLNNSSSDRILTISFDTRVDLLNNVYNTVKMSYADFFDKYFTLFDENETKIKITDSDIDKKNLRLNINKIMYTDGTIDNEFYGIIIDLASVLVKHKLKITQPTLVGGDPLILADRELSAIEKVRNLFLSKNELDVGKLTSIEEQIYATYDLLFDLFIDYDPNNLIDAFLKSHYTSRVFKNCSPGLQSVVLDRRLLDYKPIMPYTGGVVGGDAINHGALIQGIMEQLGGNNLAYDMYLSDTTLQLHNNELEHSVMSDIMRGGRNLNPDAFKDIGSKVFFNTIQSTNELYCRLDSLLKSYNLSDKTMDGIEHLFKENMENSAKIMRLLEILKKMENVDETQYNKEEDKYFIKSVENTTEFEKILEDIKKLKEKTKNNAAMINNVVSVVTSSFVP